MSLHFLNNALLKILGNANGLFIKIEHPGLILYFPFPLLIVNFLILIKILQVL